MQSLVRCRLLASRAPRAHLFLRPTTQTLRFAHQSYGNEQSGHEQDQDAKNPKGHLEHPGPEAPATKESKGSSSSDQPSSSGETKDGDPKIYHPPTAAEKDDPEVRAHNEDMRNRHEQSVNQLAEGDNKVDPKYWKGRNEPVAASI